MRKRFPDLDVILIELGGDNLAATFSPSSPISPSMSSTFPAVENPPERRPRHHPLGPPRHQQDRPRPSCRRLPRSDGARRRRAAQGEARPFVMANMKTGDGVDRVIAFLREKGGLKLA